MLTQPAITPILILAVLTCVLPRHLDAGPPVATTGDRICVVGNTFAERMRIDGFLETRLAVRRPDLKLTVRNLGWSATPSNCVRARSTSVHSMSTWPDSRRTSSSAASA